MKFIYFHSRKCIWKYRLPYDGSFVLALMCQYIPCICLCIYKYIDVQTSANLGQVHDDVIKWKHFPRYWPFMWGIHWSPVNSPHKGQWRGALMFSLICAWINGWVSNIEASDLRCHHAHYDVTVMDGIWYHRTAPSLVQVMTWCLFSDSWIKIQSCELRKINWKILSA